MCMCVWVCVVPNRCGFFFFLLSLPIIHTRWLVRNTNYGCVLFRAFFFSSFSTHSNTFICNQFPCVQKTQLKKLHHHNSLCFKIIRTPHNSGKCDHKLWVFRRCLLLLLFFIFFIFFCATLLTY